MSQLETSARKAVKAAQEEATRQHKRAEELEYALAEITSYDITDDHDGVLDALRMQEIAREALCGDA